MSEFQAALASPHGAAGHDSLVQRNLKILVSYDGTDFHGWQVQPGIRTVQGILVALVSELTAERLEIDGASRTDAGVHARGQTASFRTRTPIPLERLARAINGRLPADVRVWGVEEVPYSFHARFSAIGKHYRYLIDRRDVPDVFLRRSALHYPGRLEIDLVRQAAASIAGEHDFAAFSCRSGKEGLESDTIRTLHKIGVEEQEGLLALDFWGKSFLYKMVRTLAGSLLEVGRGKWSVERLVEGMASLNRAQVGPTLPAKGLCLKKVYYDASDLQRDLEGRRPLDCATTIL